MLVKTYICTEVQIYPQYQYAFWCNAVARTSIGMVINIMTPMARLILENKCEVDIISNFCKMLPIPQSLVVACCTVYLLIEQK